MKIISRKRWSVFSILEPKYSTKEVLLATYKVGERNRVEIQKGAYAGEYFIAGDVVKSYPIGSNGRIPCYLVPLAQLEKL